ncbi:MAG: hypothetical protein LC777_06365, partial [Actinobacteria bacterium]|nr:hypothetical protein [Actinomycetota bacterium]
GGLAALVPVTMRVCDHPFAKRLDWTISERRAAAAADACFRLRLSGKGCGRGRVPAARGLK